MLIAFVCVLNLEVWAQTNFRTFGYAEALSVAKEENKKIFIDFVTINKDSLSISRKFLVCL